MKRLFGCLFVCFTFFCFVSCNGKPSNTHTQSTGSLEDSTLTTQTAVSTSLHDSSFLSTANTSTTPKTELSSRAKELLDEFDKYVIHDIVFDMPLDDVLFLLGELTYSERADDIFGATDGWFMDYKNLILTISSYDIPPYIESITVVEGTYLGLTIGESTKADADALLGIQPGDKSIVQVSEDPGITKLRCTYRDRDGATIIVFLEDDVVVRVSSMLTRE